MRIWAHVLAIAIAGSLLLGSCAQSDSTGGESKARRSAAAHLREDVDSRVPERAIAVYQHVLRTGRAPSGYVGGRVFENRERNLPARSRYHEYDVNPRAGGRSRGAERIVVDLETGEGWYTADHYRTLIRIERRARDR